MRSELRSTLTQKRALKRQAQDPEIQTQAQILGIPYVELDLSSDVRRTTPLVELRPSTKSWLDLLTMDVTGYPRSIILVALSGERSRPHQGKITAQKIEQLRQAVEI